MSCDTCVTTHELQHTSCNRLGAWTFEDEYKLQHMGCNTWTATHELQQIRYEDFRGPLKRLPVQPSRPLTHGAFVFSPQLPAK